VTVLGCGSEGSAVDAPGGGDGSQTIDAPPGAQRVFITNQTFTGALVSGGGLAGGDAACATAAMSGGLGGTWKAWLSTTTVNAIDRITGTGPWFDVRGTLIFASKASLMTSPATTLWYSESGLFLSSDKIWTGTGYGGTYLAALSGTSPCGEWTSAAMSAQAKVGQVGRSDASWTAQSNTTCDQLSHLICFEN
jgi:hypothetical protein